MNTIVRLAFYACLLAPLSYSTDLCFGPARVIDASTHRIELQENGLRIRLRASQSKGHWAITTELGTIVEIFGEDRPLPLWPNRLEETSIAVKQSLIISLQALGTPVCFIRSDPLENFPRDDRRDVLSPAVKRATGTLDWKVDVSPCVVRANTDILDDITYLRENKPLAFPDPRDRSRLPLFSPFVIFWNRNPKSGHLEGSDLKSIEFPSRTSQLKVPCTGNPDDLVVFLFDSAINLNSDLLAYAAANTRQIEDDVSAGAASALRQWANQTRIQILPDARSEIQRQVVAARADILRLSVVQAGALKDPRRLTSALVDHYCFDLRDRIDTQTQGYIRDRWSRR